MRKAAARPCRLRVRVPDERPSLPGVLFGVSPVDPLGLFGATSFVLGVALAAGTWAAREATRVDPIVTLRHD